MSILRESQLKNTTNPRHLIKKSITPYKTHGEADSISNPATVINVTGGDEYLLKTAIYKLDVEVSAFSAGDSRWLHGCYMQRSGNVKEDLQRKSIW